MNTASVTATEAQEEATPGTKPFIECNNTYCSTTFKYTDWVVHNKIDGPDPRDHFANERNFLSWLRTGMALALIGFMTLLDIQAKDFAPSKSLPWINEPVPTKIQIISYIMISLGVGSLGISVSIYFKNQRQLVNRLIDVGHGWPGYSMAFMIMLFICFVMIAAMAETTQ